MCLWSIIVYGRTYEADYRLLAIPVDFTTEDVNWAKNYIKATTRKPEQLPGNPRWSLFKNQKHCVIGVTCNLKDLISNPDLAVDKDSRPIHVFVGYVIKVDENPELYREIPNYTDHINLFQAPYNSVKDQWLVKSHNLRSKPQTSRFKYIRMPICLYRTNSEINPYFFLNMDDSEVKLWSNSPDSKCEIWETACSFVYNYKTVSLCLGMPTEKDVLESPFLNATVPGVKHNILKRVNPLANNAGIQDRRNEPDKKIIILEKERIYGAVIGVIIWGAILFNWMVIAIILGGLFGGSIVFLYQKYRIWIEKLKIPIDSNKAE
ncbi:MAG: hypothetical protein EAZ09_21795 [Oscillatoriales cyanobacterium]|nr:MAG: hypothetical protein EAZ18_18655 [Oscillatoriales cyanobacterium]TAH16400.1 MAG: hypothetical protein EAZ09_21795 [Oscillatoriales cyanobacterium]